MAGASNVSWQEYLGQVFPGYLLPASMRHAIDARIAERFLSRLDPRPDLLELMLSSSLLAGYGQQLRSFCDSLADLERVLPSRTHVDQRSQEGGFHGRLAVPATMKQRVAGRPTHFITHTRRSTFERPENQLVQFVARRLLGIVASVRKHKLLPRMDPGKASAKASAKARADAKSDRVTSDSVPWKRAILECEIELDRLLLKSRLGQVPACEELTSYHEQAALAASHPCYEEALIWLRRLHQAMDERDPQRMAEILSQGALRPLSPDIQFEIAVLVRLVQAIEDVCVPAGWDFQRSIVMQGRDSIARFQRDDGTSIEVFYNQTSMLPASGERNAGLSYYFANNGLFRPDIALVIERPGLRPRGVVFEVKHSERKSYLQKGYEEALLYRYEYADHLIQWPKAVLVCSASKIANPVSRKHDVVAVDWARWVPEAIVQAIVPGA